MLTSAKPQIWCSFTFLYVAIFHISRFSHLFLFCHIASLMLFLGFGTETTWSWSGKQHGLVVLVTAPRSPSEHIVVNIVQSLWRTPCSLGSCSLCLPFCAQQVVCTVGFSLKTAASWKWGWALRGWTTASKQNQNNELTDSKDLSRAKRTSTSIKRVASAVWINNSHSASEPRSLQTFNYNHYFFSSADIADVF